MKKFLAMLLVLSLALTMGLAGVASAEDVVTLRIFLKDGPTPDDQMVSDALSDYVFEKLGFRVQLVKTDGYYNQLPLLLASDEQMDANFDAGSSDYYSRVRSGAYAELSDLLKLTPALVDAIPELFWEGAKVDNKIYGISTYKETATTWGLCFEKEFAEQAGFDWSQCDEMADIEPLLVALKEAGDRPGLMFYHSTTPNQLIKMDIYHSFDIVPGDSSYMSVVRRDDPTKVLNYYDTDEFEAFCNLMHSWYVKGYIAEDILTRNNYNDYIKNFKMGVDKSEMAPMYDIWRSSSYGKPTASFTVSPILTETASATGSMFCIPAKSQHKEEAIKFLELWNTDPFVKNTICYGLEGVHFTVLEDGRIHRADDAGSRWSGQNWTTGNSMISYIVDTEPLDKWEQYKAFGDAAIPAVTLGFAPDTTAVLDQIAMCQNAVVEYGNLLFLGVVDPAEYLPIFRDALHASGSEQIIAEFQRQFEEWKVK